MPHYIDTILYFVINIGRNFHVLLQFLKIQLLLYLTLSCKEWCPLAGPGGRDAAYREYGAGEIMKEALGAIYLVSERARRASSWRGIAAPPYQGLASLSGRTSQIRQNRFRTPPTSYFLKILVKF